MELTTDALNSTDYSNVIPVSDHGFIVVMYSVLLVVGAVGNIGVLTSLVKSRRRKSRVNMLMTHLVVADLIVTFIVIPLEIGWRKTNAWLAGYMACKIFLVLRAFGLYLSSNILICISVDRKRSKIMLSLAWIFAILCSLPQSLVFRVMRHPKVPEFEQCVSFEAFANHHQELAYNVLCLCAMYFLPLLIISVCYVCIYNEIFKNSTEHSDTGDESDHSRVMLRRSDQRPLARARRRTLRMTVSIVTVFACCWLPYATMTLWYMIDRKSAMLVSSRVQDFLFMMAVSNSCMNPLVYGSYTMDSRRFTNFVRNIICMPCITSDTADMHEPVLLKSKQRTEIIDQDVRLDSTRHQQFPFEDISSQHLCVNSEPVAYTASDQQPLKPAHSCELFTVPTPRTRFVS